MSKARHPALPRATALLLLLLLLLAARGARATLDYTRVHLVDHDPATGNLLFRGNMPTNATHAFALDTLLAFMRARANQSGVPFPRAVGDDFTLTDISLNNDFDGADFNAEKAFWHAPGAARYGRFVNWPLGLAGILGPGHYPASKIGPMANGSVWKVDKIPDRVAQIRAWLTQPAEDSKVLVQYVHCTAGCDRTGEVVGAYRMRFQQQPGGALTNTTTMYALDTAECGRSPNYWSTMALEWFCEYVAYNGFNKDVGDCTGFATCHFAKKCTPTHNATRD